MNKFFDVQANILGNSKLHKVQIEAYTAALAHYNEFDEDEEKNKETLIVMPTGTGKTGLMSLLPFSISKGKVLIITPGKIVNQTVFNSLDTIRNPENSFWYKHNIIFDREQLPLTFLYKGFNSKIAGNKDFIKNQLNSVDIVITNIHKIANSSEEVNLINLVGPDFFDMIIIDEAHHVAANMWQNAIESFNATKIIKLTATPFRSDKAPISKNAFDLIYEYSLGEAISDGLVKNIVKHEAIPGEMEFYNPQTKQKYTLEQAKRIVDNDWISKSVALSEPCSKEVIRSTKKILLDKRESYSKHQILAITCNDAHAQLVTKWFEEEGLTATYVSSNSLTDKQNEERLAAFSQGEFDAMVSIQMLGEGYDNPNISLISIFRPFKTLGPYAQAIGRGLRKIHDSSAEDIDNFCNVVYHQELGLEELWEYYKRQENYVDIYNKLLREVTIQMSIFDFEEIGFVEKVPTGAFKTSSNSEEILLDAKNIGQVSKYVPNGMGKEDAFTPNGFDSFRLALQTTHEKKNSHFQKEKEHLLNLLNSGVLNQQQYKSLIRDLEEEVQGEVNQNYVSLHDMLLNSTYRKDYTKWLTMQIEKFFEVSTLEKEGMEISEFTKQIAYKPLNNLSYIVSNIRIATYEKLKKRIDFYTAKDFALAKETVIEKLNYWKKQYGLKEEDIDER